MTLSNVICAISGGVDSAVAALLLRKKGYNVLGVFMRNWDLRDEVGHCSNDDDRLYAKRVCKALDIRFHEVDLIKEYWTDVFMPTIEEYENGNTPNPDVLCNRYVKFDVLYKKCQRFVKENNVVIATGHYARTTMGESLLYDNLEQSDVEQQLLMGTDQNKDQTFFLHQISSNALLHTYFPLGNLYKTEVKEIAANSVVDFTLERKESMGICFIGRRDFSNFIQDYIPSRPGNFICYETGKVVGEHKGYYMYTTGQRSGIGGQGKAYAVLHRDRETGNVFVVPGMDHPALYSKSLITGPAHWIGRPPSAFNQGRSFYCKFRFMHREPLVDCEIIHLDEDGRLLICLQEPLRGITVGQNAVLYSGEQCLGGARIDDIAPSIFECQSNDHVDFFSFRKNTEQWLHLLDVHGAKLVPQTNHE